jgi:hypothetical protein
MEQNFLKIRLETDEMFHADRRTNTKKLLIALRNFTNAPNKFFVKAYMEDAL